MLGRFRVPEPPEKRPKSTGKEQPTCVGFIFLIFLYALKKITGDMLHVLPRFQRSLVIKKNQTNLFHTKRSLFSTIFWPEKTKNNILNTFWNIFIASNNIEIGFKTYNQSEIKIIFEFRSTISVKFKGREHLI
jgi:hypothetical protein